MKIVFISNYFNHHQKPLSDALAHLSEYAFITTSAMTEERRAMGWEMQAVPDYVCSYGQQPHRAEELLRQADAVIAGSAPEKLIQTCIRRNQLVFRYHERPLKNGNEWKKYLPRLVKWHLQNPAGKRVYLLCASAYTAADYAKFGLFRNKAFRWGYFPPVKRYEDPEKMFARKKKRTILWVGRLLDWKHPEYAVMAAARLKTEGIPFQMDIIGEGEMEQPLRDMIRKENLQDCVQLKDFMKPEDVRRHMEESEIFLFTSDRKEGWGAVLNEAMNSGCAVVASDGAGSVPYLIFCGENGRIYPSGDTEALTEHLRQLLAESDEAERLGRSAYSTICESWNAEVAAERLVCLLQAVQNGEAVREVYSDGPGSQAPLL